MVKKKIKNQNLNELFYKNIKQKKEDYSNFIKSDRYKLISNNISYKFKQRLKKQNIKKRKNSFRFKLKYTIEFGLPVLLIVTGFIIYFSVLKPAKVSDDFMVFNPEFNVVSSIDTVFDDSDQQSVITIPEIIKKYSNFNLINTIFDYSISLQNNNYE